MKPTDKKRKVEAPLSAQPSAPADAEISGEDIAFAAYCLWEQDGRPNGRDQEHWFRAEKLLRGSPLPAAPSASAPPPSASPAP